MFLVDTAIRDRKILGFIAAYQKYVDFSSNPLICLYRTPDSSQVGLVGSLMSDELDRPRSLRDGVEVARRRTMPPEPHSEARATSAGPVFYPDFDPLDGGVDADILFLFEKSGPKTSPENGGLASSPEKMTTHTTAEAILDFARRANLSRERTVIWNVIPGWNGKRGIGAQEWREGCRGPSGFLSILRPNLRAIVLVGRKAERAKPRVQASWIRPFVSPHPSPVVRASRHALWETIPAIGSQAAMEGPPSRAI